MFNQQLWHVPMVSEAIFKQLPLLQEELQENLRHIATSHHDVRFASSLAIEDMVITEVIARLKLPIKVFTLNTGKLHKETLELLAAINTRFPTLQITQYEPKEEALRDFDRKHGIHSIYESLEQRKLCCHIRKIEPLQRALTGADAWITGQRRAQSTTRSELAYEEWDEQRGIAKFNPLYAWREDAVWGYSKAHKLPLNKLYENGYPSIGCEPCTRPIRLHEDIRAGRWWWEQQNSKECGLHQQQ
ncbi:phosphoadenylyl-sulfate reductase [Oligella sp. HMSC05A10]|uniref:phosphoadenylyl-sulfate reductase n=1 Tax=Oligella sp. HMSC05A10 TaxID=1581112 RepID=UPI000AD576B3|nr:phosphoadenylyl-sulfate reductase [Oligella sp. HMSC05A10]